MEDQALEAGTNGQPESAYKVISYPGKLTPGQYLNMIYSKWMRSLKYGNDYFRLADSDDYYAAYNDYIDSILARPNSLLRLAVLSDDYDVVLGWSLMEGTTLHYVWVQAEQRNKGIAKTLCPGTIDAITHLTKSGASIWQSKLPRARFTPFQRRQYGNH